MNRTIQRTCHIALAGLIIAVLMINPVSAFSKTYDPATKTITIQNDLKTVTYGTIQQLSVVSDNVQFEEILVVTTNIDYSLTADSDFVIGFKQFRGANNITSSSWEKLVGADFQPFNPVGKTLIAHVPYEIRMTLTKPYESDFSILTNFNFGNLIIDELTWWNSTMNYRITNTISGTYRPYVITVNQTNASGTNTATLIYYNGHALNQFNDSRFTLNDATTLPYWKEYDDISGVFTNVTYVNVTGAGEVENYYGAPTGTTTTSNENLTFLDFDEFNDSVINTTKWNSNDAYASVSESAVPGTLQQTGIWDGGACNPRTFITSSSYDLTKYQIVFKVKGTYGAAACSRTEKLQVIGAANNSYDVPNDNTWREYRIYKSGGNIILTENGVQKINAADTNTLFQFQQRTTGDGNTILWNNYVRIMPYSDTPPQWSTWGTEGAKFNLTIDSWYNNYTNSNTSDFNGLTNYPIKFNFTKNDGVYIGDHYNWTVNGTDQAWNYTFFNWSFSLQGTTQISGIVYNTTSGINSTHFWNVTALNYPMQLLTPANLSTTGSTTVSLTWREWPTVSPHTYQVSTDSQFINIVSSGTVASTTENYSVSVNLAVSTHYYWHVKNNGGAYSPFFEFTTPSAATTPGQFNITVFDEQNWNNRIMTFTAQLYNSTTVLNKSTTTGWANFSSVEVASGEYWVHIVPNSSYASRSVLATSPGNVTLWIPSTLNTIDTVSFYLLDYTGRFPWDTSYLKITKNNSIMHSSYFSADAEVSTYLIRGDSYGITVINGADSQFWGSFVSTASTSVNVVVMNIGVNTTDRNPFAYNVSWGSNIISLQWRDMSSVLTSLNYTIYQSPELTQVHSLITSVPSGFSNYTVTNTSTVYFVYVAALTTDGWRNQSYVIDYRAGQSATSGESQNLYNWNYGSVVIPSWVKNAFAVIALCILAGSFGALHRGEGGIIVSIMSLFFWKWGWLADIGTMIGFLGGLLLFAILYHIDSKRKGVYA